MAAKKATSNPAAKRKLPEGRRFKPGQSGNPTGRPRATPGLLEYIRSRTKDGQFLVEFLLSVVRGKMPDELLGAGNVQPDIPMRDRISAAKELLERGYGKAPINIELDAAEGARAPVLQILLQAPAPSGDSATPTP